MNYTNFQSRCFIIQGSHFNERHLSLEDFESIMWSRDYEHVSDLQNGLIQVFEHKQMVNQELATVIVFKEGEFVHSYPLSK